MNGRAGPALAALLLAAGAQAAPDEYTIDRAHTFPSFEVSHLGISTQRGRFDKTTGRIVLDRVAGTGLLEITIDTQSVSTGSPMLDTVLRAEDFFSVEKFPSIGFKSTRLEFEAGIPRRANGNLTMLATTLPVVFELTHFGCTRLPLMIRTTCGADVQTVISRKAFGMGSYANFIGDEVTIKIQIEAVRVEKPVDLPPPGG